MSFFITSIQPVLSCVNFEARYIHHMDVTGFFGNFLDYWASSVG